MLGAWLAQSTVAEPRTARAKPDAAVVAAVLSDAVCPIVYPLDQEPAARGYHYIFYGNAFFINDEGYLLTAAHVLNQLNGVQPYILLRRSNAPPRLLPVSVVASDTTHDVALLRATPNPFAAKYQVRSLPLLIKSPSPPDGVTASALRPSRLKDPHSFDAFVEDRPSGEVLDYQFTSEHGHQDTELFLFSHEVLFGDSGAPVVADKSQAVVGLIEGRWLRPTGGAFGGPMKQSTGIGAAVPIHYALPLLQQHGIAWHAFSASSNESAPGDSPTPQPLSLVAPPYPSETLQSGEVLLDAGLDEHGQLADIHVVRGDPPFSDKAVAAARTWTFVPARVQGQEQESRIGIAVEFRAAIGAMRSQPLQPISDSAPSPSRDILQRGPLPTAREPLTLSGHTGSENSAILSAQVDAEGHPSAVQLLRGDEAAAPSLIGALSQWRFLPAMQAGASCASTFIAVEVVRAGASTVPAKPSRSSQLLAQ